MTMMNAIPSAHICFSSEFIHLFSNSIRLVSSAVELSPQAIKALEDSRKGWQNARIRDFSNLLFVTKLVAVGVILEGPELVYELVNVIKRWAHKSTREHAPSWITLLGLVGWLFVSIGVAGEFWVDGKVNSDDENIQSINITLLEDASASASQAKFDAGAAKTLAGSARTEADSFEKDIVSAKQQAAKAEADLADARQQATRAQQALQRIRTPRSISNEDGLIISLSAFKGTKYAFLSVFQDPDSTTLIQSIDDLLQKSGWVRDTSVRGFPSLSYETNGKEDFSVPVGINQGIRISTESAEGVGSLRSRKIADLPEYLQAAAALKDGLSSDIVPANDENVDKSVNVDKGTSTTARIAVGSKPLE